MLGLAAWAQILTPLQRARFFHQCYPYGPDLLSLMSAAASAENEPRASEIFQAVTSKTGSFQVGARSCVSFGQHARP